MGHPKPEFTHELDPKKQVFPFSSFISNSFGHSSFNNVTFLEGPVLLWNVRLNKNKALNDPRFECEDNGFGWLKKKNLEEHNSTVLKTVVLSVPMLDSITVLQPRWPH